MALLFLRALRARGGRLLALLPPLFLAGCTGLVFQPARELPGTPTDLGLDYREIRFEAADGVALHGWFLPARGEARGTVVQAHGNAANIAGHVRSVAWLTGHGYNVFAFDYRGYGRSAGTPDMPGVHRDTVAALDTADGLDDLPRRRLVLLGQSMGGAIAIVVSARLPADRAPGVLVADSAPRSYRAVAREQLAGWWPTWPVSVPLSWLVTGDYAALEAAGRLPAIPKLFIGNTRDQTIPFAHARRLHAAATPPADCWRIAQPGHVTTFANARLREAFLAWLDAALAAAEPPAARPAGCAEVR